MTEYNTYVVTNGTGDYRGTVIVTNTESGKRKSDTIAPHSNEVACALAIKNTASAIGIPTQHQPNSNEVSVHRDAEVYGELFVFRTK